MSTNDDRDRGGKLLALQWLVYSLWDAIRTRLFGRRSESEDHKHDEQSRTPHV